VEDDGAVRMDRRTIRTIVGDSSSVLRPPQNDIVLEGVSISVVLRFAFIVLRFALKKAAGGQLFYQASLRQSTRETEVMPGMVRRVVKMPVWARPTS